MEIIPSTVSDSDVRDEAIRRSARCGYCSRQGEPLGHTKCIMAAPTDRYRRNYERIFGKKE